MSEKSFKAYKKQKNFCNKLYQKERKPFFNNLKVGLLPSKETCYLKPFKNYEKCFLFHLKNSFRSQDIYVLVMTFWSCRKKGLIRKIKLTSKFMTSQPAHKQLQYKYCPISHEVKATRQCNLIR